LAVTERSVSLRSSLLPVENRPRPARISSSTCVAAQDSCFRASFPAPEGCVPHAQRITFAAGAPRRACRRRSCLRSPVVWGIAVSSLGIVVSRFRRLCAARYPPAGRSGGPPRGYRRGLWLRLSLANGKVADASTTVYGFSGSRSRPALPSGAVPSGAWYNSANKGRPSNTLAAADA
jgi:hypothetical protein